MPLDGAPGFDFRNPDYELIFRQRIERLTRLRKDPALLPALKAYYRDNPADFIEDWGCTFDPRNVERDLPAIIPFLLFPKQREWIKYVIRKWRAGEPGLTEKSRDSGLSWLSIAFSCTLCLFNPGLVIGYGSRKEEYVDRIGDPKSLFQKARVFIQELPVEFRSGWVANRHAPHMRILFPETGALMTGESGDNIGRGDRAAIYFVDEAAFLERPQLVENSLSQTTNCRQDISTPNGLGNPFEQKRHSGRIEVFTFHWKDDPRKDDAWYQKQVAELDPVTVAQEIDIDYAASVEGVLIPRQWVLSAVDAHLKLNFMPSGRRFGSLDVADEGADLNAFCGVMGIHVEHISEWSGKGDDIFGTVERAFLICDEDDYAGFRYDADGLGAGCRGDARIINERRRAAGQQLIEIESFRGSEAPYGPEEQDVKGRQNKDFFANRKAQGWWALRSRFQRTHRWVSESVACSPDDIISISSGLKLKDKLLSELSQPTYGLNAVGKIVVDKKPDGTKSPNLADAVMIQFARTERPFAVDGSILAQVMGAPRRRHW